MLKKTLITSLVLAHLALILLVCGVIFLEEVYPFHPGDLLYSLQDAGEQARLTLTGGRASRAEYAMILAERRLADLAQADTPERIRVSISSFEEALQTAAVTLDEAPQGAHDDLYQRLDALLVRSEVVVQTLGSKINLPVLQELHSILILSQQVTDQAALRSVLSGEVAAAAVPFLSSNIDHGSFELFGGHYGVACQSCHQDGEYKGTADDCKSCHQPEAYQVFMAGIVGNDITDYLSEDKRDKPAAMYPDHYAGQCSDCHTVENWSPTAFNHKGVFECLSCHKDDTPSFNKNLIVNLKHYPGDCKLCHSSYDSWEVTEYGHEGVEECESCHNQITPTSHYEGVCSNCHLDIQDWNQVVFDHGSRKDCQTCHTADTPANHFDGQCSNCHNTTVWINWEYAHPSSQNCANCHDVPSDHDYTAPCSSCHHSQKGGWELTMHPKESNCEECHTTPARHYDLPCRTCHLQTAWNATVDHAFDQDCLTCHTRETPSNHYVGSCEDCHNTDTWENFDFNHTYYTDCVDCHTVGTDHYTGQCSECHSTDDWWHVDVDHGDLYDCLSCHNTPEDHWPGQCSACHIVSDWSEINFDHATYTNCKACHPRPAGHPRGQCSDCHDTESWLMTTPTPVATLAVLATMEPTATETPVPTGTAIIAVAETPQVISTDDVAGEVIAKPTKVLVAPPLATEWVEIAVTPVPIPQPIEPRPTEGPLPLPVPVPPSVEEYVISPILQVNEMPLEETAE